jgi:SSS family solute:Na+ symporter
LRGLVYSLTPKPSEGNVVWYERPTVLAVIVLAIALALNIIFF